MFLVIVSPFLNDKNGQKWLHPFLIAPENPYGGDKNHSEDGSFKGHLVRGRVDYTFNKHAKAGMLFEALEPGNYYSDRANDPMYYFRVELTLTY